MPKSGRRMGLVPDDALLGNNGVSTVASGSWRHAYRQLRGNVSHSKVNRGGRPAGARMPCGWGCGAELPCTENAMALHEVRETAQTIALPRLRDRVAIPRLLPAILVQSRGVPGILPSMSVGPLSKLSFAVVHVLITGRPPGPRPACGCGCGAQLMASEMRGPLTRCAKRLQVTVGSLRQNLARVGVSTLTGRLYCWWSIDDGRTWRCMPLTTSA